MARITESTSSMVTDVGGTEDQTDEESGKIKTVINDIFTNQLIDTV